MSSKVHSQGNTPFSWENKPGISKAAAARQDHHHHDPPPKLPPPPCPPPPETARVSSHDLQIPLPPCPFLPPSRNSAGRKGVKLMDDPFLIAYKEVTKSVKKGKSSGGSCKGDQGVGLLMKNMAIFSCKHPSCSVAEDCVVRLSRLPNSRSQKERVRRD